MNLPNALLADSTRHARADRPVPPSAEISTAVTAMATGCKARGLAVVSSFAPPPHRALFGSEDLAVMVAEQVRRILVSLPSTPPRRRASREAPAERDPGMSQPAFEATLADLERERLEQLAAEVHGTMVAAHEAKAAKARAAENRATRSAKLAHELRDRVAALAEVYEQWHRESDADPLDSSRLHQSVTTAPAQLAAAAAV